MKGLMDNKHILDVIAKELLEKSRITGLVYKIIPFDISICNFNNIAKCTLICSSFFDIFMAIYPLVSLSVCFHHFFNKKLHCSFLNQIIIEVAYWVLLSAFILIFFPKSTSWNVFKIYTMIASADVYRCVSMVFCYVNYSRVKRGIIRKSVLSISFGWCTDACWFIIFWVL